VSHIELRERSLALAGRLTRDLGYVAGDKLALVLGGNCVESVIAQLAAAAARLTVVTATKAEDKLLEGCRGMVVSSRVLQGRSSRGLLADEQHPPIVTHEESGVRASRALSWNDLLDARWDSRQPLPLKQATGSACREDAVPLMEIAVAADHTALLAVYGGAKASEKQQTQGQITDVAAHTAAHISLTDSDRVAVAVPLDSPFGFAGALAGMYPKP
jgi:hypothetical protein